MVWGLGGLDWQTVPVTSLVPHVNNNILNKSARIKSGFVASCRYKTYRHSWHKRNIWNNISKRAFSPELQNIILTAVSMGCCPSSVLRSGLWVTLQPQVKHLQTDAVISSTQIAAGAESNICTSCILVISCWHVITSFLSAHLKVLDMETARWLKWW